VSALVGAVRRAFSLAGTPHAEALQLASHLRAWMGAEQAEAICLNVQSLITLKVNNMRESGRRIVIYVASELTCLSVQIKQKREDKFKSLESERKVDKHNSSIP
jgi:hypothetical protein